MIFHKESIYDSKLNIVANTIAGSEDISEETIHHSNAAFADFLNTVTDQTDSHIAKFLIFIPHAYRGFVDELPADIKRKIVLTVPVKASQPENYILAEELREAGFEIAVDVQDKRSLETIPQSAKFIILDAIFMGLIPESISQALDKKRLLVKNIENYPTYESLKSMGVRYFAGEFIEKPQTISTKAMPASKGTILQLLGALSDPDVALEEISRLITLDNVLSYRLLKIVNSPLFRGVQELTTIQDAIIRFGYNNLKKWGLTLSLTGITDKPNALTILTLERAVICANLAQHQMTRLPQELFYTTGLFSTLDAFFDSNMESLLESIAIDDHVKDGILSYSGEMGQILKTAIGIQHGSLSNLDHKLQEIYQESIRETSETLKIIGLD